MKRDIQFNARLPIKITKRKKWVLASCPVLDIHSQGKTAEQAKANLSEALSLFFSSCFERGTLDAVLKQCGFKAVQPGLPQYDHPQAKHDNFISVPIPFLVDSAQRSQCRV